MLKKIPINDVRVGMHVHRLEGSWLGHSYWRTRFRVADSDELERLRRCGAAECWIDDELGEPEAAVPEVAASVPGIAATQPPEVVAAAPAPAVHVADPQVALREAASICERGRVAVVALFHEARMGRAVDAESCLALVDEISKSVTRNPGALVSLARLKSRDDYSYMHSVAVCALMVALARQLGHDEDRCRVAGLAGLMHDIGKALMPLAVLNKPGRLTDAEMAIMREHPARGHELLVAGGGAGAATLDVALHHHEKVDGTGYPHKLAGEQISELSRMGAICDVYDATTSNRPYKAGWDPAGSIARMAGWRGHFDPKLFAAFVQSLGIYPTGSVVRLQSQRLAVVAEQNPERLVAPVVSVFFSLRSGHRIMPQRLDLAAPGTQDCIVGRASEAECSMPHLNELWVDPDVLRRMGLH